MRKQFHLPAKPFLLIRHAETSANTENIACGDLDSEVTAFGFLQSRKLSYKLRTVLSEKEGIIHTGLLRTKQTAQILGESIALELVEVKELSEHKFGEMEGLPWETVLKVLEQGLTPPYGESRMTYVKRVISSLTSVLNNFESPVIVAHGGTFFSIAYAYGFIPKNIKNCEALKFIPNNDSIFPWEIYQMNDHNKWERANFLI